MKKMLAVLIALVMVLSAVSAFAEISTYMLVGAQDAEGNLYAATQTLVFAIDDETNECAFGAEGEEMMAGTWEFGEITEEVAVVNITFADETTMVMYYTSADDSFAFLDENGVTYVMMNLDALANEAA